jgi:heme-degrading monooxygenase HmoA
MDHQSLQGNPGAQVWQKPEGDITHIWTISWWEDFESIRAFAGGDMEKAKYYEEDKGYLLELEPSVAHCECFGFR